MAILSQAYRVRRCRDYWSVATHLITSTSVRHLNEMMI
jgi:hypothetical protein